MQLEKRIVIKMDGQAGFINTLGSGSVQRQASFRVFLGTSPDLSPQSGTSAIWPNRSKSFTPPQFDTTSGQPREAGTQAELGG